jgi:sucrose-6-phosphate hydrolase SacC (GH32 family)
LLPAFAPKYLLTFLVICLDTPASQRYADKDASAQALLFRSDDLVTWRFQSVFWLGPHVPGTRVDTPDTFELEDGSQAFLWLQCVVVMQCSVSSRSFFIATGVSEDQ